MSASNAKAFKAFETFWTDLRMKIKMISYLSVVICTFQVFLNLSNFIVMDNIITDGKSIYMKGHLAKVLGTIPIIKDEQHFEVGQHSLTPAQFSYAYRKLYHHYNLEVFKFLGKSFLTWLVLPVILFFFKRKSLEQMADRHLGGTEVISEQDFSKKIQKNRQNIPINKKISIPFECENRHFLIIGKQGAGKSQIFGRAIKKIEERNKKNIIYDYKGDYVAKFYNPKTDLIFNPLDNRSLGWCLFNEIKSQIDIENISFSIVPDSLAKDPYWDNGARDLVYSVLYYCWKKNLRTNKDFYEISKLPVKEMLEAFSSIPGCERGLPYLLEPKIASNMRSVFFQKVKCFEYAAHEHGTFSIKEWISNENIKGKIFLVGSSEIKDIIAPLFTLFLDMAAKRYQMLTEDLLRRTFFHFDEFGTLKRLNSLPDLLKLSRSYGGSVWLGIQDTGQMKEQYGEKITTTIIANCANTFIMGMEEPYDAEYFSKKISDKKVQTTKENLSFGVEDYKDGHSVGKNEKIERAVLAAEILGLPDLNFYLKLSSIPEYTLIKINYSKFESSQVSFQPKEAFFKKQDGDIVNDNTEIIADTSILKISPNNEIELGRDFV